MYFENLSASGKQIFLMGDFKINLLRFHNCKYAQKCILISLHSFNLTPIIDKPTRVHHNSYSLIDNLFASNLEDTITSGNIISDLTDHFSQFCILNSSNDLFDLQSKKNSTSWLLQLFKGKILKRTVPTWPDWSSLRTEWRKQISFCVLQ